MSIEIQNQTESISPQKIGAAIEAILYAAGHPVEYEKLSEVLGISVRDVKNIVEAMKGNHNGTLVK